MTDVLDAMLKGAIPLPARNPMARPVLNNADGTVSTERTITIQAPNGAWVNIPSIVRGRQVSDDEAAYAFSVGENNPVTGFHPTVEDAISAAQRRTMELGKKFGTR